MEAALNGPLGRIILEPTVLTIGSSQDNQLVLHSSNIAEHQAEIRPEGQGYSITDLGSANGTFVNGQRLDWNMPHLLNPGDSITIGDTAFTYEGEGIPSAHSGPEQTQAGQPQGLPPPYAPPSPVSGEHTASADLEHTVYGSGIAEGMQPPQPYGQSYPQPPSTQPVYPGSMPSYTDSASVAEPAPPQAARRGRSWIWITL